MKKMLVLSVLFSLILANAYVSAEEGDKTESYSLWLGGHYTEFDSYGTKVGEYSKGENETWPEFKLQYLSTSSNSVMRFYGHYFDDKNINAKLNTTVSDKFKASVQFRSMNKLEGQDLLTEIEAREYLPASGTMSGKMLTHEIFDPGAKYETDRKELLTKVAGMLSEQNKVRFEATHRMILKSGTEQKISSNHCFSCHLTSQTGKVENVTHQIEAGVDAEISKIDIGYRFGYRTYENNAPDVLGLYDQAKHPVTGLSGSEFGGRIIFDDGLYPLNSAPSNEKISHKVKFKGNVGEGLLATSFGYSQATNNRTDLKTDALSGAANYTTMMNEKTKFIAKAAVTKVDSDTVFVDIPTYRETAADSNYYDFDYTRYSVLDRTDIKLSAEVINRFNNQMTLALKAGYDITDRDNFQLFDDGISTKKMYLQGKMRYRKGLNYSTSLKARFDKITDPFTSSKFLFESSGETVLDPITGNWVFYFQREDLRYQNITTEPTQIISFDWQSTYSPNMRTTLTFGLKGQLDKNNDLDSLDVKHTSLVPSVAVNLMPSDIFSMHTGYSYNYDKSTLPVTIALFDG